MNTTTKVHENLSLDNLPNEIWKDIPDYEGLYQISNLGRVKSLYRIIIRNNNTKFSVKSIMLKQGKSYYYIVVLYKNKIRKTFNVHTLIAITFFNYKPNGYKMVIDHKDHNPLNNNLDNLQIITQRENCSKDKEGTSKYTGVIKKLNKYESSITINGNYIYLGRYFNEIDAYNAYNKSLNNIHLYNGNVKLFKDKLNIKSDISFSSKYKGVSFSKRNNKWKATTYVNGKQIHLGFFDNEYEAYIIVKNYFKS